MRFLFFLLIILGGIGAGAFYTNADLREKVRDYQVSDEDRAKHDAYIQGKALFRASWENAPNATFEAWGDDALETANPVPADNDLWMARGHVTVNKDGQTKVQEAWCLAFNRKTGVPIGRAVGKEAEDFEASLDSGQFQKSVAQKSLAQAVKAAIPTPVPKATPVSGSWMWSKDGRGPLDQPAKKGGQALSGS